MPAIDGRHVPSHHAPTRTISAAVAAIITLALAACTATTGIGVEGNPGVAEAVAHIPFSIGYIERSYSSGRPLRRRHP